MRTPASGHYLEPDYSESVGFEFWVIAAIAFSIVFGVLILFGIQPVIDLPNCAELSARTNTDSSGSAVTESISFPALPDQSTTSSGPAMETSCVDLIRREMTTAVLTADPLGRNCYLAALIGTFLIFYGFLSLVRKKVYFFAITIIFSAILSDAYLIIFSIKVGNPELIGVSVLGLFAAVYFLVTLITTIENTRYSARQERRNRTLDFTLNIILDMRRDDTLTWHRANIRSKIPDGVEVDENEMAELLHDKEHFPYYSPEGSARVSLPVYDSIVYLLNYYEFIATGINKGIVDNHMVVTTVGSIMYKYYYKVERVVEHIVQRDELAIKSSPAPRSRFFRTARDRKSDLFKDYIKLVRRWEDDGVWFAAGRPFAADRATSVGEVSPPTI